MRLNAAVVVIGLLTSASAHAQSESKPHVNAVIGDGEGYVAAVVIGDIVSAAILPAMVLPTWSNNPWIAVVPLSGVPLVTTGPALHAAHGRWVPAVASFFGWASVIATGWFAGAELSMAFASHVVPTNPPCNLTGLDRISGPCNFTPDNHMTGLALGIGIGVAGVVLMTIVDAWMARPIKRAMSHVSFVPDGLGASF